MSNDCASGTGRPNQKLYFDEHDELRLIDQLYRWKEGEIFTEAIVQLLGMKTSKAKFTYEKYKQSFVVQKLRFQ